MTEAVFLLLGLLAGAGAGVWVGVLRGRAASSGELVRLSGEVSALTATTAEVRSQLAIRDADIVALRQVLSEQEKNSADSRARLEAAREHFAEQRRQIEEMEKKVKDAFAALSSAALKSSNEQFLTLADEKFKPLRELLERYETQIKELEKSRSEAYGGLSRQMQRIEQGRELLSRETQALVAALRQPGAKGRWGEITLRNVVELTGMSAYCDFIEQASVESEAGRARPDMVVRLPGGRSIVIDSKVTTSAYLDAMQAADEESRKRHLIRFVSDVRATMRSLSAKEYWNRLAQTPEFVVMFMPGEAFFAAAVGEETELLQEGVAKSVLIASPTTLAALLMAIRYGWQQQQVAENAEKIAAVGRELHERLCIFTLHLDKVRGGIEDAAKHYDAAVGNWESRTLPAARKLKDLDAAATGKDLAELQHANIPMRRLTIESGEQ
ncbi:MAG: DNA recombination protein RmuC [Phycisphaerae bacterium]|nr:DNA recombination protein RmuC [Phycisphaerae bacterium]